MHEISFSEQSPSVRNAYRDGAYLVLQTGSSLPDVCVACGNPAWGNLIHKEFDDRDLWWMLPTPINVIYVTAQSIFGKRYVFDFPFVRTVRRTAFNLPQLISIRASQCSSARPNRF